MMRQSFGDTMNAFSSMGAMEPSSWVQQMQEQWIGDGADEVIDMPSPEEMMNAKPSINSATTSLLRLPIVGRVHWLFDIQGMTQCSVTFLYWVYGMWYTYNVLLWPHVREHHMHPGILYVYGVIGALTITSLVRATLSDPGRVYDHMQKQASSDDTEWSWCKTCCFKRPARAHHCRRCQHCVLRMDHHCPWINNCVGEGNHFAFVQLVFYAFVMSFTTLTLITVHKYYIPPCTLGDPDSIVVKHEKGLTMLSIILSLVMTCAGCGLFIMNHVSAMMDMTTIDWMKFQRLLKEKKKPPIPYVKKSCDKAYYDLCGPGLFLLYPFPCRRRRFMPTLALTHEV